MLIALRTWGCTVLPYPHAKGGGPRRGLRLADNGNAAPNTDQA